MDNGFSFMAMWLRFTSSDTLIAAAITVTIPLVIAAFQVWIKPRPRLRYGTVMQMIMLPRKPDGELGVLRVRLVRVYNRGKRPAEHVEVIFNWKPQHIEQFPHLVTHEHTSSDGRYLVQIARLNGGESVDLSLAADGEVDLPEVIYVRANGEQGKLVNYRSVLWFSLPVRVLVALSMVIGAFTTIYGAVVFLGWLIFGRALS
ncbi:hypothetical protein [Rhizobium leguminosarum]